MIKDEQASLSMIKILCVSLIFIFVFGISVMAANIKVDTVKIILANKYETDVITTKTKVSDILEEVNILILPDEQVVPGLEEEIDETRTIIIAKNTEEVTKIQIAESTTTKTTEQILENYAPIIEKIVVEEVEIPFETIIKDVSDNSETTNRVVKEGKNGLRKVTYKVKIQNEIEIEKIEISSEIINKPVDKIVQVRNRYTTSRASTPRTNPALTAQTELAKRVEGIEPQLVTFNTSAYCACVKCCGKTNGITASGAKAAAWYTLAAGSSYPIGTVIYIPYFKDKPNGGWFVVQDRGGAISSSKLDVYMDTHGQALQFGRRNLESYVYVF